MCLSGSTSLNAYDNDRVLVEIIKDAEGDKKPEGKNHTDFAACAADFCRHFPQTREKTVCGGPG
jgi:hypothetical protein